MPAGIVPTVFHRPTNAPPQGVVVSAHEPGDGLLWLAAGHAARFTELPCVASCIAAPGDAASPVLTHLRISRISADNASALVVEGPTEGYDDVPLPPGTVVDVRIVAELTRELQDAVHAVETFLNGGVVVHPARFVLPVAALGGDVAPWIQIPTPGRIRWVTATAKHPPTGSDLVVDVLCSSDGGAWTSLWNQAADRLRLTQGAHKTAITTFDNPEHAAGTLIRLDVAQVGATLPGSEVVVDVWFVFPTPLPSG